MNTKRFATQADAHAALCLDYGFDPWLGKQPIIDDQGRRWHKSSLKALAALGYPVMTAVERRAEAQHRTSLPELHLFCWADDCGGREGDGTAWDYDCTLVWPLTSNSRHYAARFPWLNLPSDIDHRRQALGRITASTRAEALREAREKFAGQFSRIVI